MPHGTPFTKQVSINHDWKIYYSLSTQTGLNFFSEPMKRYQHVTVPTYLSLAD